MTENKRQWFYSTALVCMCCQVLGSGIISIYGFFVNPLSEQFGVSVATLGIGPGLLILSTAIVSPILGIQVDRVQIKSIMLVGVVLASLSLIVLSQMSTLMMVSLCFFMFCCAFIAYGPMVCNSLLTKTYNQHLPRALSISAMGISIGGIVLPPICAFLLEYLKWQQTLAIVGIAIIIILGTLILFFVRQPKTEEPQVNDDITQSKEKHYRNKTFWLIGFGFAILLPMPILTTFSLVPHLLQLGFETSEAAWFLSLAGAAGMAGKVSLAVLSDKIRPNIKLVISTVVALGALGYVLVAYSEQTWVLTLGCLMMGLCVGVSLPMQPFLNSLYFDKAVAGAVNGQQAPFFLPLGISIAPLSGWVFDVTGSYSHAFMGAGVVSLLALLILLQLPTLSQKTTSE